MIAALCAFAAVCFLVTAVRTPLRAASPGRLARLSTLDARELAVARDRSRPLWERVLAPLIGRLAARLQPRWAGLGEEDLRRAGIDTGRLGVSEILALKVIGAAAAAVAVLGVTAVMPGVIILLPASTFAGFVAPSVVVRRRRAERRRRLLNELPDLVGLLKAFVTAGVSLEQALHLISAQQTGASRSNLLATEVRSALSDYGLGMSIEDALESMAHRLGVEELEMFAAAVAQGKRQGSGMERILRDQEAVVRLQQRNRSTAEASRVSTRLVGVLVLVYLPEFMLLIMVPLFYGIFLKAFN